MVRAFYFYEFFGKPSSDSALSSALRCFSCTVDQSSKVLVMVLRKVIPKATFQFCVSG